MYTESLNDLADQLERRSTCLSLKSELKRIRDEGLSKEEEHSKAMELVKQDCAAKVDDLEAQIRLDLLLTPKLTKIVIFFLHQHLN